MITKKNLYIHNLTSLSFKTLSYSFRVVLEFFLKKKFINLFLSLLIQFYEKYQKIIYDQCMTKSMLISYLIWLSSSIMGVSPKNSCKHLPLAHNEIKVSHQIMDAPKSKFSLSYEHVLHCIKKSFYTRNYFTSFFLSTIFNHEDFYNGLDLNTIHSSLLFTLIILLIN